MASVGLQDSYVLRLEAHALEEFWRIGQGVKASNRESRHFSKVPSGMRLSMALLAQAQRDQQAADNDDDSERDEEDGRRHRQARAANVRARGRLW